MSEAVTLREPAPKATGINKKVLAVIVGTVGLALAVSFYLGFNPRKPQDQAIALPKEQDAAPVVAKPEGLNQLKGEDYVRITAAPQPQVVPSPNPPPEGRPDLVLRPTEVRQPATPIHPQPSPREQRAQQAAGSGLFFSRKQARTVAANPAQVPGQVQPAALAPGQQPPPLPEDAIQNMQSRKEGFRDLPGTNPYLMEPYLEPRSPYEIKAGAIIPAALKTAVNSDLPGDVTAQVTENVFDSATGRYLLIPQGTTLYGRYDSVIAYGQSRLLIIWQRLIMPDGRSIKVDNLIGTDALGRAGIEDEVNHHWGRLLAGIFLSTTVSVGSEVATRNNSSVLDTRSVGQSAADAAAQEATRVGSKITERNLNIQPTIEIRPGAVIKALVNRDMILAPY